MTESIDTPLNKWQVELNAVAYKYHVIICWVAVIFDPIFAISDYFVTPVYFKEFFVLRIITVSIIFFFSNLLKKRFTNNPAIIALIPFLSISIQNAYMYSLMDISEFQTHTFAYIALFIGAGMFVLWDIRYSIFIVTFNYVLNIILLGLNSPLKPNEILINGGLLTALVAFLSIFIIQLRTNLTKQEIIARLALAESNKQLEIKNHIIQEKNKEIKDSITYAQQIQQAILPPLELKTKIISDSFIFFKPKDIVSGDFVWLSKSAFDDEHDPKLLIAAADCTGHGVPGAMVSIVCNDALNKAVGQFNLFNPGKILDKTRELLLESFSKSNNNVQDGMDISLLSINGKNQQVEWAGANNSLIYILNGELIEIKANKQPIGKTENPLAFTSHTIPMTNGSQFYLFTDGFADQFGGHRGKKFMFRQFKELLKTIADLPMQEQLLELEKSFSLWKGEQEQTDDVCIVGIKI